MGAFPVADFPCGQNLFDGQIPGFGDDQVDGFSVKFRKGFMFADACDIQLFVKDKIDIPSIGQ
jgi:hypothetical protein